LKTEIKAVAIFYPTKGEKPPKVEPPEGGWSVWTVNPNSPAGQLAFMYLNHNKPFKITDRVYRSVKCTWCCCKQVIKTCDKTTLNVTGQ